MRNLVILSLLGLALASFSGCSWAVPVITDDEIKQNQAVVISQIEAAKKDTSGETRDRLESAEKSAVIVGQYIGAPRDPISLEPAAIAAIQGGGEASVKSQQEQSGWLDTIVGFGKTQLPWLAPVLAGLGLAYKRSKTYQEYFKSVVTGVEDIVSSGKDGFTKEELYAAITKAADVVSNVKKFAQEVSSIKAEIRTNGSPTAESPKTDGNA